ncbi:hypothetical protein LOY35_27470 [Pseudomonas sp. B21-028]|jgi:hypothetical protein|uniref:hypothetical protein n=1 Tax=Pseudomonas sp. B21-028 TaxID=2895480 RepID=UPI00215E7049|nr:hypothetical protein [Pseudomonas sp. B21-028]UVL83856.1 hypothetical protein LOY35_27470 [Pseudomonas sp. B21-028]
MLENLGNEYVKAVLTGLRFVSLIVVSAWVAGKLQGLFHNQNTLVFVGLLLVVWFALNELVERIVKNRRSVSKTEKTKRLDLP